MSRRYGSARAMLVVVSLIVFILAYGYAAAPLGPPPGALNCQNCPCIDCNYWWVNGQNDTQQCRYHLNQM